MSRCRIYVPYVWPAVFKSNLKGRLISASQYLGHARIASLLDFHWHRTTGTTSMHSELKTWHFKLIAIYKHLQNEVEVTLDVMSHVVREIHLCLRWTGPWVHVAPVYRIDQSPHNFSNITRYTFARMMFHLSDDCCWAWTVEDIQRRKPQLDVEMSTS